MFFFIHFIIKQNFQFLTLFIIIKFSIKPHPMIKYTNGEFTKDSLPILNAMALKSLEKRGFDSRIYVTYINHQLTFYLFCLNNQSLIKIELTKKLKLKFKKIDLN